MKDIRELLKNGEYILFDGGMGTMLQAAGLQAGEIPESWNLTHPVEIEKVHRAYVEAGSDVVTSNTFGANSRKYGQPVAEVIREAVRIARRSGARFVAQDIGPIGTMLKPLGEMDFDEAYELFREQVCATCDADEDASPDLYIIETMTDLLETKAAVLAVKENTGKPLFATMTFEKTGRTFMGTSAAAAAVTLSALGVDAIGVNCSLGPNELKEVVRTICEYATVPVIVQANAGLPAMVDGKTVYNVTADDYVKAVRELMYPEVQILGGCCGTNPDYIRGIRRMLDETMFIKARFADKRRTVVCSSQRIADYGDRVCVVGERLNPTGKKKISQALRDRDYDLIVAEAIREEECGAEILDVNAGLPDIDEKEVLKALINELQGACPLPLQIDTSDPEALETAVRRYAGKPVINSVNGKAENMEAVLPIAKKYGAAVICLTLDENGIPETADGRIAIAKRIMDRALELGIPRSDLIVDGLVMTVSTNQAQAPVTLETVRRAHTELGLNTCLGVSNISFGLPNREVMNSAFLAAALGSGLNLPIIDPTKERYMQTVLSYRVLNGQDENSAIYIDYSMKHPVTVQAAVSSTAPGSNAGAAGGAEASAAGGAPDTIADIIIAGNRALIADRTRELLGSMSAMEVINGQFIPALDRVGELYEQGRIFLPQLMSSAETAKRGFDVIKESSASGETKKRMQIVLATVRGDIHDIGKNIVKMLLENYGYEVIDLGRDTDPQLIVDTVLNKNIRLVGLSALMTTTVKSMEETVKALRASGADCKIMVGGAVLNEVYAKQVGADYYAKDAAESAKIAAKVENELHRDDAYGENTVKD